MMTIYNLADVTMKAYLV